VPLLRAARSYYARRRAFPLLDFRHMLSMCHGWVCGGNGGGLFVLVWFSDDRRLKALVLLGVLILLVIIIVVGIARRHRVIDGAQPGKTVSGNARGHVATPLDVTTFADGC
jgi:hypothetical protein